MAYAVLAVSVELVVVEKPFEPNGFGSRVIHHETAPVNTEYSVCFWLMGTSPRTSGVDV